MLFPCAALARYWSFLYRAWSTPWALVASTTTAPMEEALLKDSPGVTRTCCSCRVLIAVLGTAFLQYTVVSATSDMLKYVVLVDVLKASTLQIGLIDTIQSVLDFITSLAGLGIFKAYLLARSPHRCLYLGLLLTVAGLAGIGSSCTVGLSWAALLTYFLANFVLSEGLDFFWTVWTPRFRRDGVHDIEMQYGTGGDMDVSAKMGQMQVVTRYPAQALAPLLMTSLLGIAGSQLAGVAVAYSAVALICIILVFAAGAIMPRPKASAPGKSAKKKTMPLSWFDVLPRCVGDLAASCGVCKLPAEGRGQLFRQWFECGVFNSMTEAIRGGYTRVIALKALKSGMSPADLALILAVVFWTATLFFWLSDVADSGRRNGAVWSFLLLGLGHTGLGLSTTTPYLLASAVLFGLGEGMSTGLRGVVKNDYVVRNGVLAARKDRVGRSEEGYFNEEQRNAFSTLTNIWSDATLIINGLIVGVVGQFFGMTTASLAYAGLALLATLFVGLYMPESKPPHMPVE
mmetsp:Transcript_81089/g.153946  ORF Transcript_81089/g.153946 Transcript_81089/m.153946 type:complete len:515 (-) Transcript_81089:69-1613(-)